MASKKIQDMLELIGLAADVADNVVTHQTNEANLIALGNQKEATRIAAAHSKKVDKDYTAKNTNIKNQLTELKTRRNNVIDDLARYDVNVQDLFNLDDKERTPFGEEFLKDIGIEYGENLQYTAAIADDAESQLENNKQLLKLNREIEGQLMTKYNEILSLSEEAKNVKDAAGYKGIIDIMDMQKHIKDNPDTFGDDGYLAKAFLSEKKNISGIDYGIYDPEPAQDYETQIAALDAIDKATGVTFARKNLANAELDDKLKNVNEKYYNQVGKQSSLFSESKQDWAKASRATNQKQKNELNNDIIKSLKFGQVGDANSDIAGYIKEYEKGDKFAKENAIYKITQALLPKDDELSIQGHWGAGFKKGSGMEGADFDQDKYGWFFGADKRAAAGSDHLLGMLKMWKSVDDMYPEHQSLYKTEEELDEIFNLQ